MTVVIPEVVNEAWGGGGELESYGGNRAGKKERF